MAKSGSITTNEKEGRSITLSWSLSSQDVANNTSTIAWTLKGSGSGSGWVMSVPSKQSSMEQPYILVTPESSCTTIQQLRLEQQKSVTTLMVLNHSV